MTVTTVTVATGHWSAPLPRAHTIHCSICSIRFISLTVHLPFLHTAGESDPYTASSESGPGDESLGPYGDSTYGRIGMAPRFADNAKFNPNRQRPMAAPIPWIYRSASHDDYYGGWDD